ncbi:MAG: diaminopimelate epimerase [Pseudomonadota bacterium]
MNKQPRLAPAPLAFRKMHGAGNDFVIVDQRQGAMPLTPALVRALGDRHCGIGFDQLAVLEVAADADLAVTYYNADGTTSAACGNATRCIAALLDAEGAGPQIRIAVTGRGLLTAERLADGRYAVDMGAPAADWQAVPLAQAADLDALPLPDAPSAVGMGNPHCVHFLDTLDGLDWQARGAAVEHDPLFPERTNVHFVTLAGPDRLVARVWERGVGRTLASGSSACAIGVAAHRRGLTGRRVAIEMEGGTLEVDWRDDGRVRLTGPIAHVFDGTIPAEVIAGLTAEVDAEVTA